MPKIFILTENIYCQRKRKNTRKYYKITLEMKDIYIRDFTLAH